MEETPFNYSMSVVCAVGHQMALYNFLTGNKLNNQNVWLEQPESGI